MKKSGKALITWGGWDGHEPEKVTQVFAGMLKKAGFTVEVATDLNCFNSLRKLKALDLIVPVWTMAKITKEQCEAVAEAVAGGTGIAGCHGGMCDAFRESVLWQFVTGGNWISHPGGDRVKYRVEICRGSSSIVEGIQDFELTSEQYYLHVDPCVEVLATTRFPTVKWYHSSNKPVDMPQVWTKRWGHGRVFYTALGHHADVFDIPAAHEIMRRGLLWAAEGRSIARRRKLKSSDFHSGAKMF